MGVGRVRGEEGVVVGEVEEWLEMKVGEERLEEVEEEEEVVG